jgi:hypothetical protein
MVWTLAPQLISGHDFSLQITGIWKDLSTFDHKGVMLQTNGGDGGIPREKRDYRPETEILTTLYAH